MSTDLRGRRVIVTGASKGIGRGVAQHFAQAGADLAICSRSAEDIAAVAAELAPFGTTVYAAACDIEDRTALRTFVADAAGRLGGLDALVNNACYIPHPAPFEDYDDAVFDHAVGSGLTSVYHAMRGAFPLLRDGGGRIVNFTSIGGLRGMRGHAGYAAAKAGVVGLTRVAAAEWARFGITVNCVAPMAMSDTWQSYLDTLPEGSDPFLSVGLHRNAAGRAGDAERDVAPVIAFLCSEAARYITGAVVPVDGGLLDLE